MKIVEYVFYGSDLMPYAKTIEWEEKSDTVFSTKLGEFSIFVEVSSPNITCRVLQNGYMVSGQTFARPAVDLKTALRAALNLALATINSDDAILVTGGVFQDEIPSQPNLF